MATIYKKKNSTTPAVLTARVYDGDVEIHSTHRLASCITYKWFYDDLMGGGATVIPNATSKTYSVDLTQVSNSGEFYCEIQVGATPPGSTQGCGNQTTDRRRVSIIECLFQTERTFNATNATTQVAVNAPHYESPIFNNEGNSWITASGNITSNCTGNVCTFTQNLTLADQLASANSARKGQVTLTTGIHICFFSIGQDYIRSEQGDGELSDQPDGPYITLRQSGPVLAGDQILVTPSVGYVPEQSDISNLQITWAADDNIAFGTYDLLGVRLTRSTAKTVKVTGTVTDSVTGLTASASIDVVFATPETIPTTLAGALAPKLTWLNTPATIFNPNAVNAVRSAILSPGVYGGGNFIVTVTVFPWGLHKTAPTVDRDVIVNFVAGETSGPIDAWNNLDGTNILTVPAGSNGESTTKSFQFTGIGSYRARVSLNNTSNEGYNANTDDMDILVLIETRPND